MEPTDRMRRKRGGFLLDRFQDCEPDSCRRWLLGGATASVYTGFFYTHSISF